MSRGAWGGAAVDGGRRAVAEPMLVASASGRVAHDAADARIHAARLVERPSSLRETTGNPRLAAVFLLV